ncbi:hypothetical protein RJZ90_001645 [Blastomyces dermatitidis]
MERHISDLRIASNAEPEAALGKEAPDTMVDLNLGDETCSKPDHSSPIPSDTWSA